LPPHSLPPPRSCLIVSTLSCTAPPRPTELARRISSRVPDLLLRKPAGIAQPRILRPPLTAPGDACASGSGYGNLAVRKGLTSI